MLVSRIVAPAQHAGPNFSAQTEATAAPSAALPDGASASKRIASFVARHRRPILDGVKAAVLLGFYVLLGCVVYGQLEPEWTTIDAFYFAMMTMSTVGYGDISPSSDSSRGFSVFMILFGVIVVFSAFAKAFGHVTGPITSAGRNYLEKCFPQIPVDLEGDGGVDFYKPRPAPIYYAKNLLPSLMLTMTVQVVSALIFMRVTGGGGDDPSADPPWTFGIAMYHCFVTATTVGYGDVSNSTQAGRLWACFHMLLAVAMVGELISTIGELQTKRASALKRVDCLMRGFDKELLDKLLARSVSMRPLVKRDGKGLTELEFVLCMCIELNVVEWDLVQPFIKQFRMLDVNGDARLGEADLALMVGKTRQEIAAMSMALPQGQAMSVSDRMGVAFERESPSPTTNMRASRAIAPTPEP